MNMQAMLKQAQNLQKEMLKAKDEIDKTEFTGESALVKITMLGTKEVTKVKISKDDSFDADDLDVLEDMILVAVNEASKKVDDATEKKMSKYGNIPGLF
jgi:DNA-binding YbaB/EbfC family protein